jgi:uncharacterized protein (DUF488 family)
MSSLPEPHSTATHEIFTVGHSTRSFGEFLGLLQSYEIRCLVDVRKTPKSRRMPHFRKESLEQALPSERIDYLHLEELGGWRRPVPGSPNAGWRSKAFQGYADHMRSPEFESALSRAMDIALHERSAIMCAESLWWRCHRMLISDLLTVRGWSVLHVGSGRDPEPHRLTPFAVVEGDQLVYPPAQPTLSA